MKVTAVIIAAFAALAAASPVELEPRAGIFGPFSSQAACASSCRNYPGGGVRSPAPGSDSTPS